MPLTKNGTKPAALGEHFTEDLCKNSRKKEKKEVQDLVNMCLAQRQGSYQNSGHVQPAQRESHNISAASRADIITSSQLAYYLHCLWLLSILQENVLPLSQQFYV